MAGSTDKQKSFFSDDTSFNLLMQKRIRKVLVICSQYDFYMLEEDGRIDEHIFNEYVSLNLRYPPVFIHADSAKKAMQLLSANEVDLVVEMLSIGDVDAFQLAVQLKSLYPSIPIVVLTHFSREVSLRLEKEDLSAVDYVFSWLGNSDIFLAIIKLIEDSMNAENDILRVGVQSILLVEDSVRYISYYLPLLYRIILEQSKEFVKEALNEHQQMLRRRGRPKILLAKNYQEAMHAYEKYKGNILGVISDVSYKASPDRRDTTTRAGIKFCRIVKKAQPNMPFLLQSSDPGNEKLARENDTGFLNKYSKNLSNELRDYMLNNFGFGEFIFRDPKTGAECFSALDLKSLQDLILSVPDNILDYHARREDFSKWLNARALFPIARKFRETRYDEFRTPDEVREFIYNTISSFRVSKARGIIAEFDRSRFDDYLFFSRIGEGSLGGKARGLAFMSSVLNNENFADKYPGIHISVPPTVVLSTDIFETFMQRNDLYSRALALDSDEEILSIFIHSSFPDSLRDDLYHIASIARRPIAVRSSSKLEDSLFQPFAGVYNTYMIPPHSDPFTAVTKLEQAIKAVYASVFFQSGKSYITATSNLIDEEKMGIVLQSVCGNFYGNKFYPTLSGVARSLNYYPVGKETTEDGIVNLAFGLGKQIAEGGTSLRFSPKYPKNIIQLSSPVQTLKDTQKYFYALDLIPENFRPSVDDTVNLLRLPIKEAENEGSFHYAASTFDLNNHVIRDGLMYEGKRIITFSSILNHNTFPLPEIVRDLLEVSSNALNQPVEIEFAANLDVPEGEPKVFSYLQVRPIVSYDKSTHINMDNIPDEHIIVSSDKALGNGRIEGVKDLILVKLGEYNPAHNKQVAMEIQEYNERLRKENRSYVLIGPGRWGSSDPWLGIPVQWQQISFARLIVELGLENFKVEASQGTHFFHNLTSFGVGYFTITPHLNDGILNRQMIEAMEEKSEGRYVKHLHFNKPLFIEIDGRRTRGVICRPVP
jgi:hypothetical protein